MKKFLLSIAVSFFSVSVFAINWNDFSLSVEPFSGIRNGQIDEYVFLKNSSYSDDKLSELNWEIKNEFYLGAKIRGGWRGFFEETFFSFGIPKNSGQMQDSDWLNIQYANQSAYLYKTHYSESDNHIDHDYSFGFKGGYDFLIKNRVNIKPSVAFEYSEIKFTAKGATCWYGQGKGDGGYYSYSDAAHRTVSTYTGDVIDYKRVSYYFWLGSDFTVALPKNFSIDVGLFVAPYVYAVSYDTHIVRKDEFADLTVGYFSAFKGNLGVTYKLNERHSFSLGLNYFYLAVIRGNSYKKKTDSSTYTSISSTTGGAGAKWFDLSISYKFKIF